MGKQFDALGEDLAAWIVAQPVFFVAIAPLDAQGSISCSPEGNRDELMIIDDLDGID